MGYKPRKKIFIKQSGDLADDRDDVLNWIACKCREGFTVLTPGGGTRITDTLDKLEIKHHFIPRVGREIEHFEGEQIARNELELNQRDVQDMLAARGAMVTIVLPVCYIGTVMCRLNGDTMVEMAYHGFDEIYVLTLDNRGEKKREQFAHLPKVQVVTFPRLETTSPNAL
jgi:hypothetical protein